LPSVRFPPWWSWFWPLCGLGVIAAALVAGATPVVAGIAFAALVATVFAAVYHAEVIAHHVGEPFGTLVLAIAVTIIEVALIVSVMIGAPDGKPGLARDTVFAAVIIVCNGIVGLSLLAGGVRHHVQAFRLQGANAALGVLGALTVLTMIVPNVTVSAPGPAFTNAQLVFAGFVSLVLYGSFVFVQTVRHREYFLPVKDEDERTQAHAPAHPVALSLALLLIALAGVVGLAKTLTPALEATLDAIHAPKPVVGIVIAALVLLPEGMAAYRAARANQLQTSLNLALGSALASIGLTIPAVAVASIVLGKPLDLGLGEKEAVLLALTLFTCAITLGTGRTTVMQGIVHLVIFAAFLFFAVVP